MDILVSVVIPTYNRVDYLEDAIRSVIYQTYNNIEVIIIDDNVNKPEIRNKIITLVSKYPMCTLLLNTKNLGGALNRNEGIKAAKGELISFLDDDDIYEPTRIEKVVALYKKTKGTNVGIIYTWCKIVGKDLEFKANYCNSPSDNPLYQHMRSCLCATSQWTVPAEIFNKVGLFEDTPCKQDSIMLLKILGAGFKPLCVEEVLSSYRSYSTGKISSNVEKHLYGEDLLQSYCRKYYDSITKQQSNNVEKSFAIEKMRNYSRLSRTTDALKQFVKILTMPGDPNFLFVISRYLLPLIIGFNRFENSEATLKMLIKKIIGR